MKHSNVSPSMAGPQSGVKHVLGQWQDSPHGLDLREPQLQLLFDPGNCCYPRLLSSSQRNPCCSTLTTCPNCSYDMNAVLE